MKDSGECIGRVSCHERSEEDESITDLNIRGIAYLIDPTFQKQGYATEATMAMIDYMFGEVNIREIRTNSAIQNFASWRIMEKLGFTRQDEIRKIQYTFLEEPVEAYSYILTKEEWFHLKSSNK